MSREVLDDGLIVRSRAMASDVTIRVGASGDDPHARARVDRALGIFATTEAACTRFDPSSPLMLANAGPERWHAVGGTCFDALVEARRAYVATDGRFDPRVWGDLIALGYDRSLPFAQGNLTLDGAHRGGRPALGPWCPRFRVATHEVLLGSRPVDLGGIAKGLAVRWAAQSLADTFDDFLVEAGGDCICAGSAPDGEPWRVGVEDPAGSGEPVAVLALEDRACATSSVRLRRWRVGGTSVHHLIDPDTGLPGGDGLASVTVVGGDPAESEVWSKTLFLAGADRIGPLATGRRLAAIWVDDRGSVGFSPSMARHVLWQAP